MWEIFAGRPPFDDIAHDYNLIFQICKGLRPQILPEMPDDYAQMMQKCWDVDPSKRPTIGELWDFAYEKSKEINNNSGGGKKSTSLIKRLFNLFGNEEHEINISGGGGGVAAAVIYHMNHIHWRTIQAEFWMKKLLNQKV